MENNYFNITVKDMEDAIYNIFKNSTINASGRKFIYHTGKAGAIDSIVAFERACGKSEEDVQETIKRAKIELKDGAYRFDSSSVNLYEYLG
jgi:hypothetical protein